MNANEYRYHVNMALYRCKQAAKCGDSLVTGTDIRVIIRIEYKLIAPSAMVTATPRTSPARYIAKGKASTPAPAQAITSVDSGPYREDILDSIRRHGWRYYFV